MSEVRTIYEVRTLAGEIFFLASNLDLVNFYRMCCSDGYLALNELKAVIPFHAIAKVRAAPPEMLAATETKGAA